MIYINNNKKLADLLEKMLEPEKLTEADKVDAKDLIIELRSSSPEVSLVDDCSYNNHL